MWSKGDRVTAKTAPGKGVGTVVETKGTQRVRVRFDTGLYDWYYMNEVKAAPKGR